MSEIKGSIVIDTGILIEYIEGTDLGKRFKRQILENDNFKKFFISPLVYTEILYIICRSVGFDQGKDLTVKFLKVFVVCEEEKLREEAAKLKCRYPISLADCYSIALSIIKNIPIFMKQEIEIENILKQGKFPAQIIFIDDI